MHFVTYLTAAWRELDHCSFFCKSMPMLYIIDERRLISMRKLLYHDNPVLRKLAFLPVVYYEYINLCSQYAIKDQVHWGVCLEYFL